MEKVIVAFESADNCQHISNILKSADVAYTVCCRSAGEVRRLVGKQSIHTVICGYKLSDGPAERLFEDLPETCSMLMKAPQGKLNMCANQDIFRLPAPVAKGDLIASVRLLLQVNHRLERFVRPRRSDEETDIIDRAKRMLMDRNGMTEEQAHRFIQKRSMDSGARMVQTAQMILNGNDA